MVVMRQNLQMSLQMQWVQESGKFLLVRVAALHSQPVAPCQSMHARAVYRTSDLGDWQLTRHQDTFQLSLDLIMHICSVTVLQPFTTTNSTEISRSAACFSAQRSVALQHAL